MLKWLWNVLVPTLPAPRAADDRPPPRCPLNAEGPFYTVGHCLACGLPEGEAPDLLAPLADQHHTTYFARQLETPEEVERACRATEVCCVDDVRYGGTDPAILARLHPGVCDHELVNGRVVRTAPE